MATVPRFYKNHIAEGKGILIFSIVLAIFLRIIFTIFSDTPDAVNLSGGYLWQYFQSFVQNSLYSFIGSSILVALMAISVAHINTDFVLIRRRTLLPPAVIILLFSCHPSFIWISPAYLGVLFMLLIISVLFDSYNEAAKAIIAFKVTFILSLGSLFTPILLIYVPLSWVALIMMRCFNAKSLLASLLGLFIIYFPTFSFYLFVDKLDEFIAPLISNWNIDILKNLPVLSLNAVVWSILIVMIFLISLIIGDNYINRHKDKIRIRAYLSLLSLVTIVALLLSLFLNIAPDVNLYISIGVGSMLLSHYFALVETKGVAILFYIYMSLYIAVCVLSFLTAF